MQVRTLASVEIGPPPVSASPFRLLFCCDTRAIRLADGRPCAHPQFGPALWRRYLHVFDEVVVACRFEQRELSGGVSNLEPSDCEGVRFFEMPDLSSLGGLSYRRPAALRRLLPAIQRADVVICRLPSEIGLMAAALARRYRKPYLLELVACPLGTLKGHGRREARLYAPLLAARVRRAVAAAPFVSYVSEVFLQRLYPTRGRSIALSDVVLPSPDERVLARRLERIGERGRESVVGLIGSWQNSIKGVEVAIEALARSRNDRPRLSLHVLGAGDPAALLQMARQHQVGRGVVSLAPIPSGEPVLDWLDRVDLYIQPSFSEGMPRALIEAMSRGCPAIGSTAGGIAELLALEWLHPPGDAAALSALMEKLVSDPARMAVEARRNFARARAFAPERLHERFRIWLQEFAAYASRSAPGIAAAPQRVAR